MLNRKVPGMKRINVVHFLGWVFRVSFCRPFTPSVIPVLSSSLGPKASGLGVNGASDGTKL